MQGLDSHVEKMQDRQQLHQELDSFDLLSGFKTVSPETRLGMGTEKGNEDEAGGSGGQGPSVAGSDTRQGNIIVRGMFPPQAKCSRRQREPEEYAFCSFIPYLSQRRV